MSISCRIYTICILAWTISGLSRSGINALKGADEAVARALLLANERLPAGQRLEFHIVEVTRVLERYGYFDEYGSGEFEADEVDAHVGHVSIETWYKFDGSEQRIGNVPFDIENDVLNFSCPSHMTNEEYIEEFWGEACNEEYSGPTGNAGASQTYWYKTYGIVAWPKVQSIRIICESGYKAAVKCIFDQVQYLSSSNSSYQSALNDLKEVIHFGISNPVSLCGSQVSTMLETLALLHSEATTSEATSEAASLASLFLVKVVAKKSGLPYCLGYDDVVLPLVQLTQAIGWPSMSESLKTVFNRSPVSQHSRWAEFLKNVYEGSKDKDVLQKDVFFASMITCLVEKFESEVRDNKLETLSADARVQHIASLLFLLGYEGFLKKFMATVCVYSYQSPKSCLLQRLIQSLEQSKLGDDQFWIKLLVRRIQQLEEVEKLGIRPFSWNQENAVVVGHPQVEAFLRGPRQRMRYEAFNGIGHARNWAGKHFHRPTLRPYSVTVTLGGRGCDAYAVIEKTREWYNRKVKTIEKQLKELKKLRDLVNSQPATDIDCLSEDKLEPPAKKRALVNLVCLDDD